MLYWSVAFFALAVVAAVFGFFGLAAEASGVARLLFFAFLVAAIISTFGARRGTA